MNLSVEIHPDFHSSIQIIDYTREFGEYIPEETEEVLTRYENFKYSDTYTIDVIKYLPSKGAELVNTIYTDHNYESDSVKVHLNNDGYYGIYHIVIPTLNWLEKVKDHDLSYYNLIYVTDGSYVYKYFNNNLYKVNVDELIEVNPVKTTISKANFQIFSIDNLKHCYINASKKILNKYLGKCDNIEHSDKFNRDFLWMTLNVISYQLEWNQYTEAQLTLENLSCHNFCESNTVNTTNKSCGCTH